MDRVEAGTETGMWVHMNEAIGFLSAVGVFVVVYCVLNCPRWLGEIAAEDRAADRAHLDEALDPITVVFKGNTFGNSGPQAGIRLTDE